MDATMNGKVNEVTFLNLVSLLDNILVAAVALCY